ncbi:nucleotidyltransferase domain-containing protein [Microbacterium sp. 2FI]|uniref:nucleotidyltransferase domain-containing protein n=1 Tax=Microbacterium sp. 2FI TaxID=2502193 RepID=UPI0010F80E30|nr:nucleotidyltransferase domain-containing protein [Microbacterium sp. 2FI]
MQHHEDTLRAFVAAREKEAAAQGVILVGSIARGVERIDSDVDVYLVVDESEFEQARFRNQLSYVDYGVATYTGGYVDVKLVSPSYLEMAESRADDPTRASFVDARVAWTRGTDFVTQLSRIVEVPEAAWIEKTETFIAQLRLYAGYFAPQGDALADEYLLRWAAVHAVQAAGRALLADSRILFRGNKYLQSLVAGLPDAPIGFAQLCSRLLTEPSAQTAGALLKTMEAHRPWSISSTQTLSLFVEQNELSWLTGAVPGEYR